MARPEFVHLPFTEVSAKRGRQTHIVRGSGDTGVWSVADERSELREGEASRDKQDKHVRAVTARLRAEFGATGDLEGRVRNEFSRRGEARVTQFVPVFVERTLRDQLRDA